MFDNTFPLCAPACTASASTFHTYAWLTQQSGSSCLSTAARPSADCTTKSFRRSHLSPDMFPAHQGLAYALTPICAGNHDRSALRNAHQAARRRAPDLRHSLGTTTVSTVLIYIDMISRQVDRLSQSGRWQCRRAYAILRAADTASGTIQLTDLARADSGAPICVYLAHAAPVAMGPAASSGQSAA